MTSITSSRINFLEKSLNDLLIFEQTVEEGQKVFNENLAAVQAIHQDILSLEQEVQRSQLNADERVLNVMNRLFDHQNNSLRTLLTGAQTCKKGIQNTKKFCHLLIDNLYLYSSLNNSPQYQQVRDAIAVRGCLLFTRIHFLEMRLNETLIADSPACSNTAQKGDKKENS